MEKLTVSPLGSSSIKSIRRQRSYGTELKDTETQQSDSQVGLLRSSRTQHWVLEWDRF